jgi:hypothetical protein
MKEQDDKATTEDKILLMGLQQAGKTAIKDVVFFGKQPGEVEDYMATIHYERQFIDEEKKSLIIDSGGQESYWNEAVTHFRHLVFSNVKLLLWVIDLTRPDLFEESERRFSFTIRQFKKENPEGFIAVLCHKVDLISPEDLVPILDHIKDTFSDPRFDVRFEASSIYYPDSLKDLVFHLMDEAKMNQDRFELVTSISTKIEESDEFQSFIMEHKGDPRVKDLLKLIDQEPEPIMPSYGKVSLQIDLSEYDIIEIILMDKDSLAPVIGASTPTSVTIEKSMDYIIALQDFKTIIRDRQEEVSSAALIATSSNQKVHALIFSLDANFLLITSFSEITQEKTQAFYKILNEFSQKIEIEKPADIEIPVVAPSVDETVVTPQTVEILQNDSTETISVEELPSEKMDEKSIFSFLNKLHDEQLKQIDEEEAEVEEIQSEPSEPVVTEQEVAAPAVETLVEEAKAPQIEEPPVTPEAIEETKVETAEPEVIQEEPMPEPVEEKPKSRFLQRLKEESRKYQIKQVELAAEANSDKATEEIHIEKEDIAHLAEFLKEKSAEKEEG